MRRDKLLTAAVADNLRWCNIVCRSHPAADTESIWVARGTPHPLFPDLVTARPGISAADVLRRLAGRRLCSVKDSFADLDLESDGFTVLFDAQWIGMSPKLTARPPTTYVWSAVTSSAELAQWSKAAGLPVSLPAHILGRHRTTVVVGQHNDAAAAGFVATESDQTVGLSNVWGSAGNTIWPTIIAKARAVFPGRSLVGYEHGIDLAAALDAGFELLGPLRVWSRDA